MADPRYVCTCGKTVGATKVGRWRKHSTPDGAVCDRSGEFVPAVQMNAGPVEAKADAGAPEEGRDYATCPACGRKVVLTDEDRFDDHDATLRGGERCPHSGREMARPPKPDPAPSAESGASTDSSSPESGTTSTPSPEPSPEPTPSGVPPEENEGTAPVPETEPELPLPGPDAATISQPASPWAQPTSPFAQPGPMPETVPSAKNAMSERGREIAARLRETFHAYTNRDSGDNRSAQKRLGPSEVGTPCDRKLAMKLLGVPAARPQEGWAPFVGTAVHAALADMFTWANGANSGRYAVEVSVETGSTVVPRGTADLIDRTLFLVVDHKLQGNYSLRKLREEGPSQAYEVQGHIYGLGAERAGEKVKEIAIVGWPRESARLDDLYVHVFPYDRKKAEAAIKRAEDIAQRVEAGVRPIDFAPGDACSWCEFHVKGDTEMKRGCPGFTRG